MKRFPVAAPVTSLRGPKNKAYLRTHLRAIEGVRAQAVRRQKQARERAKKKEQWEERRRG